MKWARVANAQSIDYKSQSEDCKNSEQIKNDAICFDDYPSQEALELELVNQKNLWVKHEFVHHFQNPAADNYKKFQELYQTFCAGRLDSYDRDVRNKAVDHTIYFKWSEKGKDKYTVRIYISPAPQPPIKNYVKICGKNYDAYYKEKALSGVYQNHITGDGDEEGLAVDPPPPPPPPPPTLH